MKKIAIVTPTYYEEAGGGAERYSVETAKLLSRKFDVTIFTTTARDYRTWKNEFHEGETFSNNIRILRYKVDSGRRMFFFNKYHNALMDKFPDQTEKEEEEWLIRQGPISFNLLKSIEENKEEFDRFIFFTYLYHPIVYGIRIVKEKSIVITTLHDEKPAYFSIYRKTFTPDIYYWFSTPEEKKVFQNIFNFNPPNYSIIGMNIEMPELKILPVAEESYVLYIGRIESGKGVRDLIDYFIEWKKYRNNNLKLVLIGSGEVIKTDSDDIIFKGYVSDDLKYSYIGKCLFFINPSPLESFSISTMEAWIFEKAVLVNKSCLPLKGHCERSNGGLYFSNQESFDATMDYLMIHQNERELMGKNGKLYTEKNYSSEIIFKKFCMVLEELSLQ